MVKMYSSKPEINHHDIKKELTSIYESHGHFSASEGYFSARNA